MIEGFASCDAFAVSAANFSADVEVSAVALCVVAVDVCGSVTSGCAGVAAPMGVVDFAAGMAMSLVSNAAAGATSFASPALSNSAVPSLLPAVSGSRKLNPSAATSSAGSCAATAAACDAVSAVAASSGFASPASESADFASARFESAAFDAAGSDLPDLDCTGLDSVDFDSADFDSARFDSAGFDDAGLASAARASVALE